MSGASRAFSLPSMHDISGSHSHDAALSNMQRLQAAAGTATHLRLPSKSTVITVVVLIHVAAMAYLVYALFIAQRRAVPKEKPREPPKRVNCVYEWSSLSLPLPGKIRLPLRVTRA